MKLLVGLHALDVDVDTVPQGNEGPLEVGLVSLPPNDVGADGSPPRKPGGFYRLRGAKVEVQRIPGTNIDHHV